MKVDQVANILEAAGVVERGADGASFNEVETHRELQVRDATPPSRHEVEAGAADRLRSAVDRRLADDTEISDLAAGVLIDLPPVPVPLEHVQAALAQCAQANAEIARLRSEALQIERRYPAQASNLLGEAARIQHEYSPVYAQATRLLAAHQQRAHAVQVVAARRELLDAHPWLASKKRFDEFIAFGCKLHGITEAEARASVDFAAIKATAVAFERERSLVPTKDGLRRLGTQMRRARTVAETKQKRESAPLTRDEQISAVSKLLRGM